MQVSLGVITGVTKTIYALRTSIFLFLLAGALMMHLAIRDVDSLHDSDINELWGTQTAYNPGDFNSLVGASSEVAARTLMSMLSYLLADETQVGAYSHGPHAGMATVVHA
eukprot:SAG11_NODE_3066_length_2715_cov_1.813838_2_plen_110_part_00